MAEATMPVWREALRNRDHELYKAAWTLFQQNMNATVAAERLEDQKDAVVPLILEIIEDEDLYERRNLGGGNAPVNAVKMIQQWQLKEHLALLFQALEESTSYQPMYRVALDAVVSFGADVIDDVLQWVEGDEEMRPEAAQILAQIGEGDDRSYDAILSWMVPEEFDLENFAEHLIELNPERAVGDLRVLASNSEFAKDERSTFRDLSKQARKVAKEQQKAAKAAAKAAQQADTEDSE